MPPEVQTWRYSLSGDPREGWGWAIVFLDEAGCFAALSDYGDWSYRWNTRGLPEGMSFRHFLLQCEDDYILRKIAAEKEYDAEASLTAVRETITGMRREEQLTKKEAREEWDLLLTHENLASELNFWDWARDTTLPDHGEMHCKMYPWDARQFIEKVLPRLREAIKNDLGL